MTVLIVLMIFIVFNYYIQSHHYLESKTRVLGCRVTAQLKCDSIFPYLQSLLHMKRNLIELYNFFN